MFCGHVMLYGIAGDEWHAADRANAPGPLPARWLSATLPLSFRIDIGAARPTPCFPIAT